MRTTSRIFGLLAAAALVGCGQPAAVESTAPATSEQHGGILVPLTDNEAYVELLNGKVEMSGKTAQTRLVSYLLQPDLKGPYPEAPSSVEVKIGTPRGEQTVALKAAPDSADPVGSTRFASEPGPYELNQVGGEVTVKVGGKTLSGKFRGPR